MSDQPSGSLLSPGRVRRNSAGDEAAPPTPNTRHQQEPLHHTSSNFQSKSHNGHNGNNGNGHISLDESQADISHELSYGDLQYSTHSESTVQQQIVMRINMTITKTMTRTMTMAMSMTMTMTQVQYSERESLGSRERLAPPSSSSESLGML